MEDFEEQTMMNQLAIADQTAANHKSPPHSIPKVEESIADDNEVNIPFDILSQIFLNLPFKSIIRCKSVCKPWRRLLSHPDFVNLHLARNNNANQLLIRSKDPSFYSIDYQQSFGQANPQTLARNLPLPQYCIEIFGSCNGLFCLYVRQEEIVLWNPSIGDYKILPDANHSDERLYYRNVLLGGLCYDPYSDDYMIVRESFNIPNYNPKILTRGVIIKQPCVFSLKTNSWRVIETPTQSEIGINPTEHYVKINAQSVGTSINGAIYWLLCHEYTFPMLMHDRWIVGFNLEDEKFFNLSLWEDHRSRRHFDTNILAIEESLGVCFTSPDSTEIWMMQQKNRGWTKLYNIPFSTISGDVQEEIFEFFKPEIEWIAVRVFENGKIVFYFNSMDNHYWYGDGRIEKLIGPAVYDTKAESGDTRLSGTLLDKNCYQQVSYAQTLVSPNMYAPSA